MRSTLMICAALLLVAQVRAAEPGFSARPNFLIILCDDLGYGDLGCYGNATIKTPNLDRLAAQGMRLTDCYAAAPVCSSSRAGLLTGRTPNRLGVYDWIPNGHFMHLRRSETTIATLLRGAGYATCHVGKWHCNGKFNSPEQPQPGDHGFDHWFSTQNNAAPSHENPKNFVRNGAAVGPQSGFSCQIVADEAVDWLLKRDASKPFFQFVCFHEPHEPVASPADLTARYPDARKKGEALYYANVTNMDLAVGKLMAALDELKLADNTLVFFTSDNGPETLNRYGGAWRSHGSPGPLRGMKLHIYDGGIRVPGIIRWPGRIEPGRVVGEPISGVDVLPTLCDLAGVAPPRDRTIDGSSFASLFVGNPVERRRPLHWSYFRALSQPKLAMRDGDWKIVAHLEFDRPVGGRVTRETVLAIKTATIGSFELYNIRDDIGERNDLADEFPQQLKKMGDVLTTIHREVQKEAPDWRE